MKPQRLGNVSIPDEELIKDRKECKKIGPCGIGKRRCILAAFILTEGITYQSVCKKDLQKNRHE